MQFKYDTTRKPSAPVIELEVENDFGVKSLERGLLDTGADITAIPQRLVKKFNLYKSDTIKIENADGSMVSVNLYPVHIRISDVTFESVEVVTLDTDYVLVGRDLINLWTLVLDGKNRSGQIDVWSNELYDAY